MATDKDTGSNAEIEYSMKAGRATSRFNIHPEKGTVYSLKPLSAGQQFELLVSKMIMTKMLDMILLCVFR